MGYFNSTPCGAQTCSMYSRAVRRTTSNVHHVFYSRFLKLLVVQNVPRGRGEDSLITLPFVENGDVRTLVFRCWSRILVYFFFLWILFACKEKEICAQFLWRPVIYWHKHVIIPCFEFWYLAPYSLIVAANNDCPRSSSFHQKWSQARSVMRRSTSFHCSIF